MHLWFRQVSLGLVAACGSLVAVYGTTGAQSAMATPPVSRLADLGSNKTIAEADCVAARLGTSIPASAIGEPVRDVTLAGAALGCGERTGARAVRGRRRDRSGRHRRDRPADQLQGRPAGGVESPRRAARRRRDERLDPRPVRRALQHRWTLPGPVGLRHLRQRLRTSVWRPARRRCGRTRCGRTRCGRTRCGRTRAGGPGAADWVLNDEAIKNLGYLQLKKTHDAAMVLIERLYGERPRYNYFSGTSQGGREALTVAQRYPADYDGIVANVPIVNFSSLMLAPELIRIQEKPRRQLGDAREGECDSRRVHAAMRRPRRTRGRRHEQLPGVPRDLRRRARRAGPPSLGREALPGQRRSESGRHHRGRVPDRRPDVDAGVRLSTVSVRDAARQWRDLVRDVGADHRSVRQRPDCRCAVSRAGRGRRRSADALAPRRARGHGLSHARSRRQSARLSRGRSARRASPRDSRGRSTRPTPTSGRLPPAAAR